MRLRWRVEHAVGAGWLVIDPAGFGVLFTSWHDAMRHVESETRS